MRYGEHQDSIRFHFECDDKRKFGDDSATDSGARTWPRRKHLGVCGYQLKREVDVGDEGIAQTGFSFVVQMAAAWNSARASG